jgi:hypothetical protein
MYSMQKYPVNPEAAMVAARNLGKCCFEKASSIGVAPVRNDMVVECMELMVRTRRVKVMVVDR